MPILYSKQNQEKKHLLILLAPSFAPRENFKRTGFASAKHPLAKLKYDEDVV
jgi:hypothetical protein